VHTGVEIYIWLRHPIPAKPTSPAQNSQAAGGRGTVAGRTMVCLTSKAPTILLKLMKGLTWKKKDPAGVSEIPGEHFCRYAYSCRGS